MRKLLWPVAALVLASGSAFAQGLGVQGVQQSGAITNGNCAQWVTPGNIGQGAGACAAGGGITQLTSDVTAGPGSGSQAATVAANAVTNAKAAQGAANTMKGNWTSALANESDNAMPSCNAAGNALIYTTNTGVGCGTGFSTATAANPTTATVGTAAVNGSAATFMRSDAAPPINLTMVPTWTGIHTFTKPSVDNAGATGTGTFGPEGVVNSITATFSNPANTGENVAATYSLPANSLDVAGRNIRISAFFKHAANTNSVTYRIYFGTTVVFANAVATTGTVNAPIVYVLKTGSNTQNVSISGFGTTSSVAATETDTSPIVIKASIQSAVGTAGDGTLTYWTVEYLN